MKTSPTYLLDQNPLPQSASVRVLPASLAEYLFRKSEGCMAEVPWDPWDLYTHITEMRHGEEPSSDVTEIQTHTAPFY
jgi:hypothetical protein